MPCPQKTIAACSTTSFRLVAYEELVAISCPHRRTPSTTNPPMNKASIVSDHIGYRLSTLVQAVTAENSGTTSDLAAHRVSLTP